MITALLLGAAAGYLLYKKRNGGISGIGAVDNEWGANEMYLIITNTESLYNKYKRICFTHIETGEYYKDTIKTIANYLKNDIKRGYIYLQPGMGRGQKARMMAAEDIYNLFNHEWLHKQVKQ